MTNSTNQRRPPAYPDTISGKMAQFAANLKYDDLPQDVRDKAKLVLLDGLGCGLAGSTTEDVLQIRSAMLAAGGGGGDTLLWGTSSRAPLPQAALANGAAMHSREMDDFEGCLHSGSVIIPTALGTGARVAASGRDLLTAITVGYDIARRALEGCGGNKPLKDKGWHSTSVCGGFGAAVTAGYLLGLDAEKMQWALGYAGSNAGGTWAFIPDGAMSKRVHPGLAALSGVTAAYLAASNVTGPTSIFETDWGGFFPTYVGEKAVPARSIENLGSDFKLRIVGFKPYAACRGNHGSIDAILQMRREDGIRPENVDRIVIRGTPTHVKQLGKQAVKTMLDAQFSLPYSVSVSLATWGAMLDQYTPEQLRRPEILALARRVNVVIDAQVTGSEQPFVDVYLTDGRMLTRRVLVPRGAHTNALTDEELRIKFRSNAKLALKDAQVDELEDKVQKVDTLENVADIAALLIPR
jgi:2-methylcitrate dehydratase PrpD